MMENAATAQTQPAERKNIFFQLLSFLFHPLFVPVYAIAFLVFYHPTLFAGFSTEDRRRVMLIILINMVMFPLISVLLLKGLKFIGSIFLRTQKDRIIPYIAYGIFSFWTYTVFREQERYPVELSVFLLGVFLAASAGLIANIYTRISLHAMAMGGWLCFYLILTYQLEMPIPWASAVVAILTGIVCTGRLFLREHTPFQVYLGIVVGAAAQITAYIFLT